MNITSISGYLPALPSSSYTTYTLAVGGGIMAIGALIKMIANTLSPSTISDLINAAEHNKIKTIKSLLNKHPHWINSQDGEGRTALIAASTHRQFDAVKTLLAYKPDVNLQAKNGTTALRQACLHEDIENIKLLLAESNDPNLNLQANTYEATYLMLACSHGNPEIVKLLLTCDKLDINARNEVDKTALMIACEKGHIEIVKILLSHKNINTLSVDRSGNTAFHIAYKNNQQEILQLLIGQNFDQYEFMNNIFFITK